MFPDNDSREISPEDLRKGLTDFLTTISSRIGNLNFLNTTVKTSTVAAINSILPRISILETRFLPQFGEANPNQVPPVINEYGAIYIQRAVISGNLTIIDYWIFSNVQGVGWISLINTVRLKEELTFENTEIYNYPSAKKGDIFWIKIRDTNTEDEIPDGYAFLGGFGQKIVGNDSMLIALNNSASGNQAAVGNNFLLINQKEQIIEVEDLPEIGLPKTYYLRSTDDTLHRYIASGTPSKPIGWYQIGGENDNKAVLFEPQELSLEEQGQARDNIGVSSIFKEIFNFNQSDNPDQQFQISFIPTNIIYLTETGSFLQGTDVGKDDYMIDTETAELTINVELKDGAEIIICYEHQNQLP